MNIGIVTTWFERGAAYVSRQYMEALQESHEVFIYARSGEKYAKGENEWDLPNVYWSKKINSPFAVTVIDKKEFTDWIITNKIEAILFNEQHWWEPLVWCKELGVKTIAYVDYYTEKTIPLFEIYDVLICNTKKHYKAFNWHKGATYIPWGTNTDLFTPKENYNDKEDTIVFFHSCGMNPLRKGTDLLIKSLEHISQEDFKLIIHTQIDLITFFPDLKDIINKKKNLGILEIIHKTVEAPGLYYLGDVYVYPSRLEGIGLTIAEAVSSGLGLIVPDCAPMNEFISEDFGVTVKIDKLFARHDGYYWPQNEVDIKDLAKCIESFILRKNEILDIQKKSRQYALNNLSWMNNQQHLIETFNSIATHKPSSSVDLEIVGKIKRYENTGLRKYNKLYKKFPFFFKIIKRG